MYCKKENSAKILPTNKLSKRINFKTLSLIKKILTTIINKSINKCCINKPLIKKIQWIYSKKRIKV